jgi:hypothetical protein
MHGDGRWRRWAALMVLGLMVLAASVVGIASYNAGVAHGLAISASASAPDIERGAQVAIHHPYGYYGYGWHPFGFLGPLLFVFFWFFVIRMLFWRRRWGGPWGRHGYWRHGYGPGPGYGYGPPRGFRGPGCWGRDDRYGRYDDDDDERRGPRTML